MTERDVFVCASVCISVFEVYLFLSSTHWRENQTKGLEPSERKTILHLQYNQSCLLCLCVGVWKSKSQKKIKRERLMNEGTS